MCVRACVRVCVRACVRACVWTTPVRQEPVHVKEDGEDGETTMENICKTFHEQLADKFSLAILYIYAWGQLNFEFHFLSGTDCMQMWDVSSPPKVMTGLQLPVLPAI